MIVKEYNYCYSFRLWMTRLLTDRRHAEDLDQAVGALAFHDFPRSQDSFVHCFVFLLFNLSVFSFDWFCSQRLPVISKSKRLNKKFGIFLSLYWCSYKSFDLNRGSCFVQSLGNLIFNHDIQSFPWCGNCLEIPASSGKFIFVKVMVKK